jgi:hypothetical protein
VSSLLSHLVTSVHPRFDICNRPLHHSDLINQFRFVQVPKFVMDCTVLTRGSASRTGLAWKLPPMNCQCGLASNSKYRYGVGCKVGLCIRVKNFRELSSLQCHYEVSMNLPAETWPSPPCGHHLKPTKCVFGDCSGWMQSSHHTIFISLLTSMRP